MRRAAAIAIAAATAGPAAAAPLGEAAACAGGGPALLVQVVGLKVRAGTVRVELYPATEDDWLADKNALLAQGKVFRRAIVTVPAAGPLDICLGVPAPGRYAFVVLHDPDGKRGFSMASDGVGFAGDPKLGWSRPRVEKATVTLGPGISAYRVTLQYLRGLGFGPLRQPAGGGGGRGA